MGSCWGRRFLGIALGLALACAGCPKKGPDLTADGADRAGMEEEGLGQARGTLAEAQQGLPMGERSSGPLQDIHFGYDSFDLTEEGRQVLRENANWLNENPRVRVELEGHCDERGTVEYNLALGAKRAAAAKAYLGSLAVAPDRVTTISYGEELPLCQEQTESCWERNRRAHFVIVGE